ncbi:hypothetical protein LPJ77_001557 [Coemansia sp. RSA 2523]|nr:hypothetical protein LPJ54_001048 [Coemansia sp. RSA 1824]KAJ1809552.1 hypothetical protein LPJ77_001557 [Coemansia sp. RSA 2523]KAJ2165094.1 hypothetical protein GGH16_004458 [Coemansia sp. RSA 560]KAJ2188560.1 hypothetical protein EV181_002134 [Coemansia sp. RSA 532]KAJ2198041.1 hypothetical protein IW144_002110 [Coemansia sp. RSA 522]KAJ2207048.1 hypothetical protein IW145_001735 [Coemansia sp. RSA 521]KAJ2250262.1 hypothetical protein GGH97_000827 [Coemansia sp. RSA 475]KAJ2256339.1 h
MWSAALVSMIFGATMVRGQGTPAELMDSLIAAIRESNPAYASFTGNAASDTAHQAEISDIYCPLRDCTSDRDWLTEPPNAAANWVLGAISLVIFLISFRFSKSHIQDKVSLNMCLPPAGAAMIWLFISLFLRASLALDSGGNKLSIYAVSVIFNYLAGLSMCSALHVNVVALVTRFQPPIKAEKVVATAVRNVLFWCPCVLFIVGVVYSFNLNKSFETASGAHCLQAALVFILCTIVAMVAMTVWRLKCVRASVSRTALVSCVMFVVLLGIWASFMLGRLFLSIESASRTSQVLFGLLNHGVLIVCGIVALVFGHPLESSGALLVAHRNVQHPCQIKSFVATAEKATLTEQPNNEKTVEPTTTLEQIV